MIEQEVKIDFDNSSQEEGVIEQSYVRDADNITKDFNNQKKLLKGPPQQKSVKTLFKRIKAKESDQCDYVTNSILSSSAR